jgi:hypothetical protein
MSKCPSLRQQGTFRVQVTLGVTCLVRGPLIPELCSQVSSPRRIVQVRRARLRRGLKVLENDIRIESCLERFKSRNVFFRDIKFLILRFPSWGLGGVFGWSLD